MSSDKFEPLSEVWSSRFDDRDDDELAHQVWVQKMAMRDLAVAQPIRNFAMPQDTRSELDLREAANDSAPA